jgi:hypothetical protein
MRLKFLRRFQSDAVRVRVPVERDLSRLAELALELYADQGIALDDAGALRLGPYLRAMVDRPNGVSAYIAEYRGDVAGMVQVGPATQDITDGESVLGVSWLYVRPLFRDKPEVLMALYRQVAEDAKQRGCARVRCGVTDDQQRLADIYMKRLGFRIEAHATVYATTVEEE